MQPKTSIEGGGVQPSRLRFNSHQDTLNFLQEMSERHGRFNHALNLGRVESYDQGKTEVVVTLVHRMDTAKKIDLVCRREGFYAVDVLDMGGHLDGAVVDGNSLGQGMLIPIPYSVQYADGVIPSWVHFESVKDRFDINRESFAATNHGIPVGSRIVSRRERTGGFGVFTGSAQTGNGIEDMIHGASQVVYGITSDQRQNWGCLFGDLSPVDVASAIWVELGDHFVRALLTKASVVPIKISNVMLCATDLQP